MALKSSGDFLRKMDALSGAVDKYPKRAGVMAVNFSKERFRAQNWIDNHTEPWKRRQLRPGGRGTLIKSGSLKRRTRIVRSNSKNTIIGNDHPAAEAHNEGAKIMVTDKMRRMWWAKYYELAPEKGSKKKPKPEALYYRNLALTKKKFITIPRRQFMGESAYLSRQIERQMAADFNKALKK